MGPVRCPGRIKAPRICLSNVPGRTANEFLYLIGVSCRLLSLSLRHSYVEVLTQPSGLPEGI